MEQIEKIVVALIVLSIVSFTLSVAILLVVLALGGGC